MIKIKHFGSLHSLFLSFCQHRSYDYLIPVIFLSELSPGFTFLLSHLLIRNVKEIVFSPSSFSLSLCNISTTTYFSIREFLKLCL